MPRLKKEEEMIETQNDKTVVSCLKNEIVHVRHIAKENSKITNKKHVLYGGMADGAFKQYTVPMLENGQLVNVLTNDEKDFLEEYMGLEPNSLSVYKKERNYWSNYKVRLTKDDNVLDLSVPEDYIKYKVLLANKDFIAPSLEDRLMNYKASYDFVIIREEEEARTNRKKYDAKAEAYMMLGKINEDKYKLKTIIEIITGKPVASSTKLDILVERAAQLLDSNPKQFVTVVKDSLLDTKVLINRAIEAGIISNRGGQLYYREDNTPLCNDGTPTPTVAAAYLNEPKHQELKFVIEKKLKELSD